MANGRKYTTYFNADSSGFKKGTDQAVQALEKMNKELVNNQYRQKDCNKAISDAQKELKKTDEEIKKLEKEEKEKGKLDEKQKKDLDDLKAKHKNLGDTIESEKVKLAQLRTEQAGIKGTISDLSKEIAGNNKEWTTLKATIANLASDGVELLARKLLELGKAVIATGEQFTASMSEVGAISGASAEQLELLEQTAREYGSTTKFSASESAQALKYMALAGWDTQQSIESLGSVLDLAAAGNMDLARASDIVTDYITAFGLAAEDSAHFVDVMAYAMAHSNTNVEQLGEAYKNCAASAASMGYSVEEVTAVLMTMANAGVKGGEAGTTLNTIMTRLATDTKGCASALEEMGIKIFDENDNLKSLSEILQLVTSAFDGMSDKQQAALSKVIAGQNQYTGFQTILKGLSASAKETGQSFGDYAAALEECDGTSEGMAETMSDNLSGDLKTMQSAFEELALKIYDSGETPLRDLVKFVTNSVVPALDTLIAHMDIIVPIFVTAASAVGAYKAALGIMSIIKGINQATEALTAAKRAEKITTDAVTASDITSIAAKKAEKVATDEAAASQAALNTVQAANPIGLVVAALGALISALTSYAVIASQSAESTDNLNNSEKDYLMSIKQAKQAAEEKEASTEAEIARIRQLKIQYDELKDKTALTADENNRLTRVSGELAQALGISEEKIRDKTGAYTDLTTQIDEYIKKLREQVKAEINEEGYKASYKDYYEALKEAQKIRDEIADNKAKAADASRQYMTGQISHDEEVKILGEVTAANEKLEQQLTNVYFQGDKAASSVKEYAEAMGAGNEAAEEWNDNLDALYGIINKTEEKTDELGKKSSAAGSAIGDMAGEIDKAAESVDEYAKHLLNGDESYGLEGFYEKFTETGDAVEYLKDKLQEANKALEDNRSQIKKAQDDYNNCRSELKKLNKVKEEERNNKWQESWDANNKKMQEASDTAAKLKTEQVALKKAVSDAEKAYKSAAWGAKTLNERLAEIGKTSASIRSEMNSLSSTFKDLQEGNQLSLDTLLSLSEKYPDYAAQILSATDNLNAQKDVVKLLYEAKKTELIQSLDNARKEIQLENDKIDRQRKSIQNKLEEAQANANNGKEIDRLRKQLADLNAEFDKGKANIDAYVQAMAAVNGFDIYKYLGNGNKNSNNNYTPSQTTSPQSTDYMWGWLDEEGHGSTSAQARTELVERVHQLGKINDRELKAEYEKILREEQLTADESYNIRLKLYNMTSKLKQAEEEENKKRIQSRLDYAKAAYEKLVKGEIETYQKASDKIKSELDSELKKIDEEEKKRQQEEDDEKRRREILDIEEELDFNGRRMTQLERDSLLRRKQNLINEQAEIDRQRQLEIKKTELQEAANAQINKNTEMIERLNGTIEKAANYFSRLSGTQTAAQVVNNSSSADNRSYIYNGLGMSFNSFIEKMMRELY